MIKPKTEIREDGRVCTLCRIFKPWSEFNRQGAGRTGYRSKCKKCIGKPSPEVRKKWQITDEGRQCIYCGIFKPWDNFAGASARKRGHGNVCKPCMVKKVRKYREDNPRYKKNSDLAKYNGLTVDGYEAILTEQGGVCAICGKLEQGVDRRTGKVYALAVDHNHQTEKIRGLLCANCNRMIGLGQDSPEIMRKAASYLEAKQDD